MRVKVEDFFNRFIQGALISEEVMDLIREKTLKGERYMDISEKVFNEHVARERDRDLREYEYGVISEYRLNGMSTEKAGDLEEAAKQYKKCIYTGENATHRMFYAYGYAYERLFVVLRKLGRLDEERMYIEKYLMYELYNHRDKYEKRLANVIKKLEK